MNRTVVIVKMQSEYAAIRVHWNFGQPVEDWLRVEYGSWRKAYDLICLGHRFTIEKAYGDQEYMTFARLCDAKAWCEYMTLAYHNGKKWRFEHKEH